MRSSDISFVRASIVSAMPLRLLKLNHVLRILRPAVAMGNPMPNPEIMLFASSWSAPPHMISVITGVKSI